MDSKRACVTLLIACTAVTLCAGVVMARPWGDDYAHQSIDGYLRLAGFLGFAVAPYVGLDLLRRIFDRHRRSRAAFLIGAAVIASSGAILCAIRASDPQGALDGLIFIAVPIYQWVAAAVLTIVCLAIKRWNDV